MDLNSMLVGIILASNNNAENYKARFDAEFYGGIKTTIIADECHLYYDDTVLGCLNDKNWVLIAPWNTVIHFKKETLD